MAGGPLFRAAPVRVRVPATSANLGPGFDSLALSLALYDDVVAQVRDKPGLDVDVHGQDADAVPRNQRHLVVKSLMAGMRELGAKPRGLSVVCANRIPHGRGLGSSAAAIVAGLVLARGLVVGGAERMPDERLLDLASALEGHPDNVAACLYGGLVVTWLESGKTRALRLEIRASLAPIVCVPTTAKVSTSRARALLPDLVPIRDAAANISRASVLVHALTQRPARLDLLLTATDDQLHQQYRRPAYPRSLDLMAKLRAAGLPAVISGSGPTVLVLSSAGDLDRVAAIAGARFSTASYSLDSDGATIVG